MSTPITQIIHLRNERRVEDHIFDDPKWQAALDHCEQAPGFQRLYWGQSHECPEHVELHIVRTTLAQHKNFLLSQHYNFFLALIEVLTNKKQTPIIRHAQLRDWTPNSQALARGAPFSGTAIYLRTTAAWHEGAWPLWTHVVRHIDGCLGRSGGPILDSTVETVKGSLTKKIEGTGEVEVFERSYIVYVGWETTKKHHEYHHTKHSRNMG